MLCHRQGAGPGALREAKGGDWERALVSFILDHLFLPVDDVEVPVGVPPEYVSGFVPAIFGEGQRVGFSVV